MEHESDPWKGIFEKAEPKIKREWVRFHGRKVVYRRQFRGEMHPRDFHGRFETGGGGFKHRQHARGLQRAPKEGEVFLSGSRKDGLPKVQVIGSNGRAQVPTEDVHGGIVWQNPAVLSEDVKNNAAKLLHAISQSHRYLYEAVPESLRGEYKEAITSPSEGIAVVMVGGREAATDAELVKARENLGFGLARVPSQEVVRRADKARGVYDTYESNVGQKDARIHSIRAAIKANNDIDDPNFSMALAKAIGEQGLDFAVPAYEHRAALLAAFEEGERPWEEFEVILGEGEPSSEHLAPENREEAPSKSEA